MKSNAKQLLEFDKTHIWHPYTSLNEPLPVYLVESAKGSKIRLHDGRELVDGMSSWWSVIHGYNNPVLTETLKSQAEKFAHVMFGGLTHKPAIELCRKLVEITPDGLDRVFLCDSGSISVEVAMKMAIQFYFSKGSNGKNKFLTIRSGYHGDAFHSMSVCDPEQGMHSIYKGVLPEYYFAPSPKIKFGETWDDADIADFATILKENSQSICGVILEPIVQGAGGMKFYNPEYLRQVRALCDLYDVLLIADEVATGFGRSGKLFACEHAEISPDILCVGKALTGGYMTLAAVLATENVGHVISSGEPGVFMHGPTFMGNPLACSVACSSLDLLEDSGWENKVNFIESELRTGLSPCEKLPGVSDVRVLGAIGVVEMESPVEMAVTQKRFVEKGVWVRPFGKLVYVMPPYIIQKEELQLLTTAICSVVSEEVGL